MTKKMLFLRFPVIIVFAVLLLPVCAHSRAPKPGPHFVWTKAYVTPAGIQIKGHWTYIGPAKPGKVWVAGHRTPDEGWVIGHWKVRPHRPRAGAVWVKGHHGRRGRWCPGHWR